MNLTELIKQHAEKRAKYDEIKLDGDMEEVRALHAELKEGQERIELLQNERDLDLAEASKVAVVESKVSNKEENKIKEVRDLSMDEVNKEYEGSFLKAFRKETLNERDQALYSRMVESRAIPDATPYMQSAVDEDGGFIVPHSVSTQIQEYKRQQEFDLTNLVDVQTTAVLSGEFTYEKLGTITPFENISQWDTIKEVATPQFERKQYKIEDYAGILPLPRTLLQDTDANLLAHIAKYIARKSLITRNLKIMEVIEATYADKEAIVDTDGVLDAFDLALDPAFHAGAKIVTNQEGYNFLRKLKNDIGENLLQTDITQPSRKMIDGHEVVVLPQRTLGSNADKAPIYIGEFKEAIRFYDRGVYEVTPTTIGGDAFKRNSYDIRVIDRFDVIELDPEAVVAYEVDVAGAVEASTMSTKAKKAKK